MRRGHFLRFDALEARRLLTTHAVMPHTTPMRALTPLVLDGTLVVDNSPASASITMNADGGATTSLPVKGQLNGLGEVRGVWSESTDSFGDVEGLDTVQLRDSKGTFIVAFNNQTSGPAHSAPHGAVSYEHAQRFDGGGRAYAHASESGTIALTTNPTKTEVVSMSLESKTA